MCVGAIKKNSFLGLVWGGIGVGGCSRAGVRLRDVRMSKCVLFGFLIYFTYY